MRYWCWSNRVADWVTWETNWEAGYRLVRETSGSTKYNLGSTDEEEDSFELHFRDFWTRSDNLFNKSEETGCLFIFSLSPESAEL